MALALRHNSKKSTRDESSAAMETWQPFSELQQLRRDLARLSDSWRDRSLGLADAFTPLADVEETDDSYTVEIELAGVQRADIDIEVSGQRLSVRGERKEKERVGILRRQDRVVGTFSYEITLPGSVIEDEVTADLADGVLTVRLPKPVSERPRRIPIG
jgi:HSP20 family protein